MVTMQERMALVIATAMCAASCAAPTAPVRLPAPVPGATSRSASIRIRVQVREGGALVVRSVPLEEYVAATIVSEVDPPDADPGVAERMYEVQAVISRTYVLAQRGRHERDGFDVCATTHCQLYEPARLRASKWADAARAAAARTSGDVLWFANAPARAVFHSDCGGRTSSAAAVWGGAAPAYLAGERDGGPAADAHTEWTFDVRKPAIRDALNADARTRIGNMLDHIQVSARDAAGRAERVTIKGTRTVVVRGEVLRDALTRAFGVKSIRSTLFTVTRTREGFAFAGRGFGHGVGLCQAGAFARLKAGASPEAVLRFYYPGTRIAHDPPALQAHNPALP